MPSEVDARAAALANEPLRLAGPTREHTRTTTAAVRELLERRELLGLLIKRELKARYKDSVFGLLWTLVRPLVMLAIYFVAVGKFMQAEKSIPSFAVYIFTGLTVWGLFSELVTSGTSSIVVNAGLVKKVYLPREIFPLASAGGALINFGIQLAILVVAALATGMPSWGNVAYALPSFLLVAIFAMAIALSMSAFNVYLRDVQYLVEVALMVLFWASPIVYSWSQVRNHVPDWAFEVYMANPVTLAVLGFQRAFWSAGESHPLPPDFDLRLWIAIGVSVALLWLSQKAFARLQGNFAQEL